MLQVQFQRLPGSGFTAIADRIGQRNKFIHRAKSFSDDIQNMQFLNQQKYVVLHAPAVKKLLIRIKGIFHIMAGCILNNFTSRRKAQVPVFR